MVRQLGSKFITESTAAVTTKNESAHRSLDEI